MSLLDVRRSWRLLAALTMIVPAGLAAQSAPAYAADSAPAAQAQQTPTAAPLALAIAPSGVTTRVARPDSTETQRLAATAVAARMQEDDTRLGKNLALVLVGAAGVVVGARVGDTEGTVIAVGGAAIALYGLYRWLR